MTHPVRFSRNASCGLEEAAGKWNGRHEVDALVEKLDAKLREWRPETAAEVRERVAEVIELADQDVLDVTRSRAIEQEVLDLLDGPPTR